MLTSDDRFTLLPPSKSLFELFDIIDDMDAVITPDTGIGHVAAALSKPLLVAFKDSYYCPLAWKPISNQLELVYSNTDNTVNDLDWTEVRACLNRTFERIKRPELV
jgi:ADP-heptose:LPS heptosyltransferase